MPFFPPKGGQNGTFLRRHYRKIITFLIANVFQVSLVVCEHIHTHTFMSYGINIVDTTEITEIFNDEVMV